MAGGFLGVQIFFVISGFVICRGLLREREDRGNVSLPGFYIRRFFRIAPPILLYIIGILALTHFGVVPEGSERVLRSLVFVCNFESIDCGGYLGGHLWSLSVEEQFYLVFPLLFWSCGRSVRAPLTVFVTAFLALCFVLFAIGAESAGTFLADFTFIAAGVAWALNEDKMKALVSRMPDWSFFATAAAIVFIALFLRTRYSFSGEILLLPPLIAFGLAKTLHGVPVVSSFLGSSPMSNFGRTSYSLYLWQQLASFPFAGAGLAFYAATVAACTVFTSILYRYVEQPLIKRGRSVAAKIRSGHRLPA